MYARPRRKAPTAGNSVDTIVRPIDLYNVYGVTVAAAPTRSGSPPPASGSTRRHVILTKSTFIDTIFISRYGRVIK